MKIIPACFAILAFLFISSPALCFDLNGYWISEQKTLGVKVVSFDEQNISPHFADKAKKDISIYKLKIKNKKLSDKMIILEYLFMDSTEKMQIIINNSDRITIQWPSEDVISYVRTTKEKAMDFLNNQIH